MLELNEIRIILELVSELHTRSKKGEKDNKDVLVLILILLITFPLMGLIQNEIHKIRGHTHTHYVILSQRCRQSEDRY